MVETVKAFIKRHGGNAAVAAATGCTENAVGVWVHRNRLPRSAWPEIIKALPGVTLDDLLALEAANDGSEHGRAA